MPGGRPPDYEPSYCALLVEHMSQGLSYEAFAGLVGCCVKTLYNWEKAYPDFLQAKKNGFAACQLYWEKVGRDGLHNEVITEKGPDGTTTTVNRAINAPIWIFNMKNRFKWRDKQPDEEQGGDEDSRREERKLSPSEWLEVLRARQQSTKGE